MKDKSPIKVTLVRSRAIDPTVNKMAKDLTDGGYTVEILLWSREGSGKGPDRENGYSIHRFNLKAPYYKPSLLFYIPIWWIYEFFFLLRSGTNIIHAFDLDTVLPALFVKAINRAKICYTIFDFYANILPRQLPGIFRRLVASTEKYVLRFVDIVFLFDKYHHEQVRGAKIKRFEYINNSPEDCSVTEVKPAHPGDTTKTSILYAGYLDNLRGLEELIEAVRELDDVHLTLAGTGPATEMVKRRATELPNLQYLGQISYDEVIAQSYSADIHFAFYDPQVPANKYASPNKLFVAMMCGKPIIMNSGTTAGKIVAEENCGLVVPYGDPKALKETIVTLKNNPELRRKLGENGRKAYEARYNWEIMKGKLLKAYDELATSS